MLKNFSFPSDTPLLSDRHLKIVLIPVGAFVIILVGVLFWRMRLDRGTSPFVPGTSLTPGISAMGVFERLYSDESLGKRVEDSEEGCPQKYYRVQMVKKVDDGWVVKIENKELDLKDQELEILCKKIRVLGSSDKPRRGWTNSQNLREGNVLQIVIANCDESYSSFCDLTDLTYE